MTHSEVLQALVGLLLGMFVSMLASTVVGTSLPVIVSDLGGSQTSYTWVITATLLATTVSTPIWGKLADLFNRKFLLQLALVIFVVASAAAGFSQDTSMLIGLRVVQGLGAGGLAALTQIVMADIVSPRERGRYMGLFSGVMALGTVGGPLLGGFLTDSINWRWNFFVGVPVAIVAIIMLQKTLHLPAMKRRKVKIDYLGVVLLAAGVSLLLIWVSLAGTQFAWASATTAWMVGGAVVALVALVFVEMRAVEPIIPMSMFKNRTYTFAVLGSVAVGVAMFGTSVFLAQYMQLARGASATQSGLMTIPMAAGMLILSAVVGAVISRTGIWKRYMVLGSILFTAGMLLLSTISYDTNFTLVSLYMFMLGAGVGMVMQNLVLVVQNAVPPEEIGVASSGVAFFRSLGGTIGIAVLGTVLADKVTELLTARQTELFGAIAALGDEGTAISDGLAAGTIPAVHSLPESVKVIIESVYGEAVAHVFLVAAPLALLSIVAVALLPNLPLSNQTRHEREVDEAAAAEAELVAVAAASGGVSPVAEGSPIDGNLAGGNLTGDVGDDGDDGDDGADGPATGEQPRVVVPAQ
ncbi:DHA2 family efflux MFS transporter permease subunit [Occultella glacieicola]|uniref:DHA2 family efflux MFS transporter permease subunit n=2 Tax=Occultella glacieicola TaxID=2518684 RepID=A0ABY2E2K5_9MICO|nr:DHA2 family efflux MFS transporter permease subunit [Occultella glacieicola]